MNINVALPVWGTESWPIHAWTGYRLPALTITKTEGVFTVGTLSGDPTLSYHLSGGADASRFELVNGDILAFLEAPDYEFPSDTDGNNVYEVDVTLTNSTDTVVQPFLITIGDDGMSDQNENLKLAFDQLAIDIGTLLGQLGDVTTLTTSGVTNAVAALNNIETRVKSLEIDPITATTVAMLIGNAKTEVIGGASTSYDTLGKLQAIIEGIDTRLTNAEQGIATLNTAVTNLENNKASQADMLAAQTALASLQSQVGNGGDLDTRINDAANAMRDSILNGAGAAVDTLKELADLITSNSDLIATLNTVAAGRVAFDTTQNLTEAQKGTARSNISAAAKAEFDALVTALGDTGFDYKGRYIEQRNAAQAAA